MEEILDGIKANIINTCITHLQNGDASLSFEVCRRITFEGEEVSSGISADDLAALMQSKNLQSLFLYGRNSPVKVFGEIHSEEAGDIRFPVLAMVCNALYFYDIAKAIIEGVYGFTTDYHLHPSDIYSWGYYSDNLLERYEGI